MRFRGGGKEGGREGREAVKITGAKFIYNLYERVNEVLVVNALGPATKYSTYVREVMGYCRGGCKVVGSHFSLWIPRRVRPVCSPTPESPI